jgi:hypothetical protein
MKESSPNHGLTGSEKDAIALHGAFFVIAFITVIISPFESLGVSIWSLIIGWYTSIIVIACQRNHRDWILLLKMLVPLSIFFSFPDGYLASGLGTILFPDMGVGRIFQVTSFMPFMWAIPLFISTMVGRGLETRGAGLYKASIGAGFIGFVIFLASEMILTRIPIWHPVEGSCTNIGNAAIYVLFPEFCLGLMTFLAFHHLSGGPYLLQVFAAFMVMCMYLGNLIVCFMIVDGDKLQIST